MLHDVGPRRSFVCAVWVPLPLVAIVIHSCRTRTTPVWSDDFWNPIVSVQISCGSSSVTPPCWVATLHFFVYPRSSALTAAVGYHPLGPFANTWRISAASRPPGFWNATTAPRINELLARGLPPTSMAATAYEKNRRLLSRRRAIHSVFIASSADHSASSPSEPLLRFFRHTANTPAPAARMARQVVPGSGVANN